MSENQNNRINDLDVTEPNVSASDTGIELSAEAKKIAAKEGAFGFESTIHGEAAVKKRFSLLDFWFYYKWHILIALFFIVIFTTLIVQAATKEKYDVRILYAGPAILTDENRTSITEAFSQQIDSDYNGDGKKTTELFDLIIMENDEFQAMYDKGYSDFFLNPSVVKDNKETLSVNAMAGEYVIFLIDVDYYQTLHDNGVFITLDSMGVTGGMRYDECALYFHSLDFAKFYTSLDVIPDDTLICVKRLSENTKKKNLKAWEDNKKFFKLMTDFKLPEGFIPAE